MGKVYCLELTTCDCEDVYVTCLAIFKDLPSSDKLKSLFEEEEVLVDPEGRSLNSTLEELSKEFVVKFECNVHDTREIWQIREVELL